MYSPQVADVSSICGGDRRRGTGETPLLAGVLA